MLDSWQDWLHGSVVCAVKLIFVLRTAPHLVKRLTVAIIKFIIIFEHGILHFHLALGSTHYAASLLPVFAGVFPMLHTHRYSYN